MYIATGLKLKSCEEDFPLIFRYLLHLIKIIYMALKCTENVFGIKVFKCAIRRSLLYDKKNHNSWKDSIVISMTTWHSLYTVLWHHNQMTQSPWLVWKHSTDTQNTFSDLRPEVWATLCIQESPDSPDSSHSRGLLPHLIRNFTEFCSTPTSWRTKEAVPFIELKKQQWYASS